MKRYRPLGIPSDSAWERKTIRKYVPNSILYMLDGIANIIRWMPTLYKDRDWDGNYIFEILEKKIEFQRSYLVKHNRHMGVPNDNYYMTICLNLINLIKEDYYELEIPLITQEKRKNDSLINFFENLDKQIIQDAKINSKTWFENINDTNSINNKKMIKKSNEYKEVIV